MTSLASALRVMWRVPLVVTLLLVGLAIVVFVFPRLGAAQRGRTVSAWSGLLLRICGVRLVERPAPAAVSLGELRGGALLLLNHVNWLDIFLVLSLTPAHFVAKIEIVRWPLVGALVAGVGTLFVERGRRRAVHELNERIGNLLGAGRPVALFPEGTTGDGQRLLPFHSNLLAPALQAGVPVVPVGIRYTDSEGRPTGAVRFVGKMTLRESLWLVLGSCGIVAEVHPLPAVSGVTRREVAERARRAMAQRLALPLDDEIDELFRQGLEPQQCPP